MLYNPVEVNVPTRYRETIKKALEKNGKLSVKVNLGESEGNDTILLTRGQIAKMERAKILGKKRMTIRMSRNQVQKNLKHEGGFLGMLIAALSAALPSIISAVTAAAPAVAASVATGAISGAVSHLVSGNGLYFRKHGLCAKILPVQGGGLYLAPHPPKEQQEGDGLYLAAPPRDPEEEEEGDGLYLKHEGKTYGQLAKSPWIKEQVPMLELLL